MAKLTRVALFVLIALAVTYADTSAFFSESPISPVSGTVYWVNFLLSVLVPLMVVMVIIAAVAYMVGQMFGAETRARATVWAHGMLVAVLISGLILVAIFTFLPGALSGNLPTLDVTGVIQNLGNTTASLLVVLTVVFMVIAGVVYVAGQFGSAEARARANNWVSSLLAGAILCAVLYIVLFQILNQLTFFFFNNEYLGIYGSVIIQISVFVAFFILVTYLVSKFFKVPEWEAYLNVEMSNLMSSFLIVMFVIALFAFGNVFALLYSNGSTLSPPLTAIAYMQSTVADSALKASIDVYKIQGCTSVLSTFSRRIGEFVLTQTYKVFPGLDTFVSITNILGMSLLALYNTVSVQIIMLYLVNAFMVPFFLPAGLILRFFPPTRDAGAFLISLAFGFQIVFPTSYLINIAIFQEIGGQPYSSPTLLIQSICGPFKYGVAGYLFNPSANPLYSILPGNSGTVIGSFLSKFVSESLLNSISMAEFIPIMRHVAALSLLTLFIPALSMMVTIAFINSMTKFILAKV